MKAKLPKLNEKLIAKIIEHIEKDIRRYDQDLVGLKKDTESYYFSDIKSNKWAPCNTKACFAGWAVILSTPESKIPSLFQKNGSMKGGVLAKARKLLGLKGEEEDLFASTGENSPRVDLKIIQERLAEIRAARKENRAPVII